MKTRMVTQRWKTIPGKCVFWRRCPYLRLDEVSRKSAEISASMSAQVL